MGVDLWAMLSSGGEDRGMTSTTNSRGSEGRKKGRAVVARTKGQSSGPVTRMLSPSAGGDLLKPFVFLDYFEFDGHQDFAFQPHPHSGIATHTTFFEGALVYGDSTGKVGSMSGESIEWMQAGGGVWHWGRPEPGILTRGYQLWVALPPEVELTPATSTYIEAESIDGDRHVRILFGVYGDLASPLSLRLPMTYLHVRLSDGEEWTFEPAQDHDLAWLAVNQGRLRTADVALEKELAVFAEGSQPISLVATGTTEFVIGSARKHPYDLFMGPSSVHTSEETLRLGLARIAELGDEPIVQEARRGPLVA